MTRNRRASRWRDFAKSPLVPDFTQTTRRDMADTYNPPLVSCVVERPVKTFSILNVIAFRVLWPASASTCNSNGFLYLLQIADGRHSPCASRQISGVYSREFADENLSVSSKFRVSNARFDNFVRAQFQDNRLKRSKRRHYHYSRFYLTLRSMRLSDLWI